MMDTSSLHSHESASQQLLRTPTLGLCMIAKDEAHVITRCLDSVRGLVDYVLIEDTGSTDGTQDVIRRWLDENNIPGQVIDEPWRDFAHNRTHALESLRKVSHIDYALVVDADDTIKFTGDPVAIKQSLTADCYRINIYQNGLVYDRVQICSNRKRFVFRSVVHEFMWCLEPAEDGALDTIAIEMIGGGARTRDRDTYRKDAELFEKALADLDPRDEDLRPRYLCYLAQSYRAMGERQKALQLYSRRIALGGWPDETFTAYLYSGRLKEELGGYPLADVIGTYHQASATNPTRAEALYSAAKLCRVNGLFGEGYEIARRGIALPQPRGVFIESWVYRFSMMDEFSVCAFRTRHFTEAFLACEHILRTAEVPMDVRARIERNAATVRAECCRA